MQNSRDAAQVDLGSRSGTPKKSGERKCLVGEAFHGCPGHPFREYPDIIASAPTPHNNHESHA
jgi:hypothetical protein